MKKVVSLVVMVMLVVALSATSVFATVPTFPNHVDNYCTFTAIDNGFRLTNNGNYNAYVRFTGVYSCSGLVTVTLNNSTVNAVQKSFEFNSGTKGSSYVGSFSNLLGVHTDSNYNARLYYDSGVSTASYEFSFERNAGSSSLSTLDFYIPTNTNADFVFNSLIINGVTYVDNPAIVSATDRYSVILPYGNALAISSSSDFSITRRVYSVQNSTYNFQKYVRASDDFSYRVNGSYQGVVSNSALTGTFGVGVYNSDNVLNLLIPWQPVNQNVLGRATDYNYYNAAPDSSYLVEMTSSQSFLIWYPYYANNQDTSRLNEVPMQVVIDIEHSAPVSFTTYPITGSTSSTGDDTYITNTAVSTDSGSSSQTGDGNGNVDVTLDNAPTAGGNHGQAPINDNNSILGVLSNLQNTFLGLFNKAIDGIHNLISLGSSFLQSVQVMFSWLPGELLVIITSGFVILLTIGVLKTLWR